jgi:putative FmdB family regulatory protein
MAKASAWYVPYMPTYAFRCGNCGHEFEVTAHIADRDEKAVCPACGSRDVSTVFGSFAVGGMGKSGSGDLLSRGFSGAALGAPKP